MGDHGSSRAYQHESFVSDVETSCIREKVNSFSNKYSSTSKGLLMVRSKKYYIVHVGRQQGIYTTWANCKAQVDGFKGAIYKGF